MTTILAVGIVVMLLMGQHDAAARLREITIPGEGRVTYGQYQSGVPQQIVLPGGVVKTMAYDPLSGMVSNRVVDASGNAVMNRAYQRSRTGGITGMNTEHGDYAYAYDAIDQLTDVGDPVLPDQSFSYDPAGNRRTSGSFPKPGTGDPEVRTYAVNNLNQYSQITNLTSQCALSYDLNGNLTQEVANGESHIFRWDVENRLVGYSNSETGVSASYYYDPFGRRLRKVVNGVTNWYVYADEGLVMEMDGQGNDIRSYGYAPNSLWMNDPLYMRVPGIGATNIYYFLNDHLGAPQELIAKNGEVVWSMESEAFGKATVSADSTISNNLRFSSQYHDEESELHYNTQRYYEPEMGRYVARDPIEEKGGNNLYGFVGNSPLGKADLVGLQANNPPPQVSAPCCNGIIYDPSQSCCHKDKVIPVVTGSTTPYKICCRGVRYDPATDPWLAQWSYIQHCDIRNGACQPDEQSFDISKSSSGNMDNGKPCRCADSGDISGCLNRNPYLAGNGTWGNNCQANTYTRLAKCCLKSSWRPNCYGYPP